MERDINSLESKYNRCFNEYKKIIQDVFPQLDDNVRKKRIGEIFFLAIEMNVLMEKVLKVI